MRITILLASIAALASASLHAEPLTVTLSEAEKAEVLANRSDHLVRPADPQTGPFTIAPFKDEAAPAGSDRRPHGEMGMMIGTGGARGIYGFTAMPLGNNGWASFGFNNSRNVWPYRPGYPGIDPYIANPF